MLVVFSYAGLAIQNLGTRRQVNNNNNGAARGSADTGVVVPSPGCHPNARLLSTALFLMRYYAKVFGQFRVVCTKTRSAGFLLRATVLSAVG